MNRREFLKLGALFTAAIAISTNPVLNAAAKLADANPDNKVLLYIIKNRKTGKWYIKGTKYADMPKQRITLRTWDVDTFRPLQIVDNSEATEVRNRLWKVHIGTKVPSGVIDVVGATKGGLKGGPKSGAIWAQRYRDNDPRALKVLQARLEGQELWKQLYPEEYANKLIKLHDGRDDWTKDMQLNHPEEWQQLIAQRAEAFSKWAADNPEKVAEIGSIRGNISLQKRKSDPETFYRTVSEYGKKGQKSLQQMYKENPELKAKNHKIACDAAAEAATAKRLANIDKLYSLLPMTFTRQQVYDTCKQYNIPANSGTQLMKDTSLSIKSIDKVNVGGGKGSSINIWTKVKQ